jgi:hypothetical protein
MRAVVIHQFGPPDVLVPEEVPMRPLRVAVKRLAETLGRTLFSWRHGARERYTRSLPGSVSGRSTIGGWARTLA